MLTNIYKAATAALLLASATTAAPTGGSCPATRPKPAPCAAELDPNENVNCIANVNGNDLEVKVVGAKDCEPILVVPSTFGHSYWYMYKGLEHLFDKYRFIFYDARGSGPFSSKPSNDSLPDSMSTAAMASDIEGIRTLFGLDQCNIFSHCQGATAALIYAEDHPENVANLYLAETILPDGVEPEELMKYQGEVVEHLEAHNPNINYNDSLALLPIIVNPDDEQFPRTDAAAWQAIKTTSKLYFWNSERHEIFVDQMEGPGAPPFAQFALEYNTRADYAKTPVVASKLNQITANVYLVHGEEDGASPKPYFDFIVSALNLTGDHAVLVPEAGHILWVDEPNVFTKTVTGWFDQLAAEKE